MTKIKCGWINCIYNNFEVCTKEEITLESLNLADEEFLNCYDYESKYNKDLQGE